MRTRIPHLLILSLLLLFAMPALAHGPSHGAIDSVANAFDDAMNGDCPNNPPPVSAQRVEKLLQHLKSEELSLGQAKELVRLARNFECGLSPEARPAVEAFKKELAVRRLDTITIMEGEADLVTPVLLPDSWNQLLEESGDVGKVAERGSEKVAPIILGCAGAIGFMVNASFCADDSLEAWSHCINNDFCSEGQVVDQQCCDEKLANDRLACYATGGFNGPDGDYALCC